ncbi:hypothetical protein [Curtobacterium sp. MCSS17_016]|uniref:hypothetical protein n=1 Tax=Curtobacterium sp. MCSS17_016 TaxID=2175644 RepID=UPI0011B822BD|nr:hypothetical protein [Curtobacterium sp. MCSS17_016]WIE81082.1 hypothetical protein DEJ19_021635 [Curtobacterium sp. MCSS17_016]
MSGMTISINQGAVTAREAARHGDGKFGEQQHDGDAITLGFAGATAEALPDIERELPYSWYEMELPSARHRKYVPVLHEGTTTVGLEQVSSADAPQMMTVKKRGWRSDAVEYEQQFRLIDGQFFSQHIGDEPVGSLDEVFDRATRYDKGSEGYENTRWGSSTPPDSQWTVAQKMQDALKDYVVIDGEPWIRTPEPVYKVDTGSHWRGPSIEVTYAPDDDKSTAPDNFFTADQYDDALAYARAEDRGESGVRGVPDADRIVVADGFNPGSTWSPAPRLTYPEPTWDMKGALLHTSFDAFRTAISTVPGAVQEDRDGRKRIDWSKLTDEQQRHYKEFVEKSVAEGIFL